MGKNIVIIGMSGSGKTTVGLLAAKKLGMKFIDMDRYIEEKAGISIADMFAISEKYFRDAETACAKELSNETSAVIATGGGIVTKKENMDYLKQNSVVVFLNRPLENIISDIDISSRPLLKGGISNIYKLYSERIHLYKKYRNVEIINDKTKEDAADSIAEAAGRLTGQRAP